MTHRARTRFGMALFIPLAAVLLATFACLPAPVGDPATARVDPAFVGAWRALAKEGDKKGANVIVLRAWDDHTYFVQLLLDGVKDDGSPDRSSMSFKAWLAPMGDARFMCLEPLNDLSALDPEKKAKFWIVMRVDKTPAGNLEARRVNEDSDLIKKMENPTRAKLEALITEHRNDDALYTPDSLTYQKLGKSDEDFLSTLFAKFGIVGL